jgi:transposase-like protein
VAGPSVRVDPRATLLELVVGAGIQVLQAMLEEDRTALCGARYRHQSPRRAGRAGTTPSEVVLGGRKLTIQRPRVRAGGRELALPTLAALAAHDPLSQRAVDQMLVGVATRQYARSLEPFGDLRTYGTSKSAVSRRFVARTRQQVETWQSRPLTHLDLAVLFVDGVRFANDCLIVALGIDVGGHKHVLGVWDGSTEHATTGQALLTNLTERGLRTDRSLLVVLDGSKALRKAVDQTFGAAACVQRCQLHKRRNVLDHVPIHRRAWARTTLQRAYRSGNATEARRILDRFATALEDDYPSAAVSVREGLEETLTVQTLPIGDRLRRQLATTNTIESLMSRIRVVHRNVKRWRGRRMALRWAIAGVVEAAKHFRGVTGRKDMHALVTALRARDEKLGFTAATAA